MQSVSLFVNQLAIVSFVGLLCWAAISDLNKYIIPNRVCLGIVALYPAFVLSAPGAIDWLGGLTVAASMFAIGFVFYAFRFTGGGDVKLLAAVSLWAGPQLIIGQLIIIAIAGGVLSLATLSRLNVFRPRTVDGLSFGARLGPAMRAHIPYGVAVAAGGVFAASRLLGG